MESVHKMYNQQLIFLDGYMQEKIWVVGRNIPGIFSFNKNLSNVHLEYLLNKKNMQKTQGLAVINTEEYIFTFMENEPCIYKVNKLTNETVAIRVEYMKNIQLEGIYAYNAKYYLIPSRAGDPLLQFDGEQIKECEGWKEKVKETSIFSYYFTFGFCAEDNKIWTCVPYTSYVADTNLNNYNFSYWKVGEGKYRFETIGYGDGYVWCVSRKPNAVVCWNCQSGLVKEYTNFPKQLEWGEEFSFVKIITYQEKIFFIPGQASDILVLNSKDEKFEFIKQPMQKSNNIDMHRRKFFSAKVIDNLLYLFAYSSEYSVVVDMNNCNIKKNKKLYITDNDLLYIQKYMLQREGCLREDNYMVLDNYLKII